jgi:PAS domain S-box-containing protein
VIKNRLDYDKFLKLVDSLHDEINIWDNNYNLVYINSACERHYGFKKEDMIGKNYFDCMEEDYWHPTLLPYVYKEKKPIMRTQKTHIGATITSIVVPFFDENGEIEYVISSIRDGIEDIYYLSVDEIERKRYEERHISSSSLLFKSSMMKEIMELAYKLSDVDSPVIILGESGVGKTLLARVMHNSSKRKDKPFITVNCGAIPKELMESELFGYEEGSFTGAKKQGKKGIFDVADGGTLLLDEISELPYLLQSKLLHVVQEKEFMPVGGNKMKKVDVKIIAATNKNLKKLAVAGSFREDLYYRLSVFEINMPPLRERKEDIELLTFYFLKQFNKTYKKNHQLSREVLNILKNYTWRGNIRELAHLIERLVVTVNDFIISPHHLPSSLFEISKDTPVSSQDCFDDRVDEFKKAIVVEAYNKYKSSRKVAKKLKISQSKATRLIRKYLDEAIDLNDE